MKQLLTKAEKRNYPKNWKGETDKCTNIAGDFNTPLSVINRTSRQKINTDIENLNYTTN